MRASCAAAAVTGQVGIPAGRTSIAIDVAEFSVIENVKRLRTKFERLPFSYSEVLEERHIEIHLPRIAHDVSAFVSERQTLWSRKSRGVHEERAVLRSAKVRRASPDNPRIRIADNIRSRSRCSHSVGHSGVVARDRNPVAAILDRERRSALDVGNARPLPAAQNIVGQSCSPEEGQIVDITQGEHVPLIEVLARSIRSQIIRINKAGIACRGSIVDGVRVSVSRAQLQRAHCLASRELQTVVDG